MHPAIGDRLRQAHVAELRDHAQRHTLARAARRARRAQRRSVVSRWVVLRRRARAALGARIRVSLTGARAYAIVSSQSEVPRDQNPE